MALSKFLEASTQQLEKIFNHIESTYPDLETEINPESVTICISESKIFLITINQNIQQIWLSSPISGGHHFFFDATMQTWKSTRNQNCFINDLLDQEISDIIQHN